MRGELARLFSFKKPAPIVGAGARGGDRQVCLAASTLVVVFGVLGGMIVAASFGDRRALAPPNGVPGVY